MSIQTSFAAPLLAIGCALVIIPVAETPASAQINSQRQADLTGRNVGVVHHRDGHFAERRNGRWVEYNSNGQPTFRFEETHRDEWSVYLRDPSRNVRLQLDLHRDWIRYAAGRDRYSDLYRITDAGHRGERGSGGWRFREDRGDNRGYDVGRRYDDYGDSSNSHRGSDDRRARGHVRSVKAGPIWNRQDADVKCPIVAYAVEGKWTGAWRTTQWGQMSVCDIEF